MRKRERVRVRVRERLCACVCKCVCVQRRGDEQQVSLCVGIHARVRACVSEVGRGRRRGSAASNRRAPGMALVDTMGDVISHAASHLVRSELNREPRGALHVRRLHPGHRGNTEEE